MYLNMRINKSTRHSKITGDFSENLILYWLSKYGFECANIDHTGIDIIAHNPKTREVMGISVKSRSRNKGTEETSVSISNDNFNKIIRASKAFNCVPYFAIVVDEKDKIYAFITSMKHLLELFPKGKRTCEWKMGRKYVQNYYNDPKIMIFEFNYRTHNWWK